MSICNRSRNWFLIERNFFTIPKLEIDGVSYPCHLLDGETLVFDHISFDVSFGEFPTIVGSSGCDKSTLLSMLCGLIQPEGDTTNIDGIPLTKPSSAIGHMLQKDYLFEWRNIFSNIPLGLEIQKWLDEPARQELLGMTAVYNLASSEYARPSELSGGVRQETTFIRVLAFKPDLLLLDEPFSALDYQTRLSVCDDINSIICQTHKIAILVAHDLPEAIGVADRILILSPHPDCIRKIPSTDFPKICTCSLDRRNCPKFSAYFNMVWRELKTYEWR